MSVDKVKLTKKSDFDMTIQEKFTNQRKDTKKFCKKQKIIEYMSSLFV